MLHTYDLAPGAWEIDDNGFLRIKTRVMSVGVMAYTREELGEAIPPELANEEIIYLAVLPDALAEPHAIRTLEGMPITVDEHIWQTADGNPVSQTGSIAGTPVIEGPYLVADMVLTNNTAIDAVVSRNLSELSAAYNMEIIWEPGEYDGQLYHGRQTRLRYNHTTLLRAGEGRAGRDVRVLNKFKKNEDGLMSENPVTLVSLPGGVKVRVANEDAARVADAVENAAETAKEETTTAFNEQVTNLANEMKEAQESRKTAEERVKELEGKLEEMKGQLDAALSPEAMEEQIIEIQDERNEAAEVMNASTLPDEFKKLRGHALRSAVVSQVRAANSLPALSAEELADEAAIKGRFSVMKEYSTTASKRTVTGASVVNTGSGSASQPIGSVSKERFNKLYGKKGA